MVSREQGGLSLLLRDGGDASLTGETQHLPSGGCWSDGTYVLPSPGDLSD